MKLKLFNKRLELLHEIANNLDTEVKVSDKGNYYVYLHKYTEEKSYDISPYTVTKNKLHTIGQTKSYPKSRNTILMLTSKNKLLFNNSTRFVPLSINHFKMHNSYNLHTIYFYNKKCEWLKNYKDLWRYYNFFKSFKSLKEARHFLGYKFISDKKFAKLDFMVVLLLWNIKEKPNLVNLLKTDSKLILDTFNLAKELQIEFKCPKGKGVLKKLHDDYVHKINLKKIESKSTIKYNHESKLFEKLDSLGLDYKILNTERALFIEGKEQHHCVGAYFNKLKSGDTLVSIKFKGENYTCHYGNYNNKILQIKGKYNKAIPDSLRLLLEKEKLYNTSPSLGLFRQLNVEPLEVNND